MTTIKPATPLPDTLPLRLILPDDSEHFGGRQPELHDVSGRFATVYGDDKESKKHAAYIVAACNAYPELVAALREFVRIASERDQRDVRTMAAGTEARALLRKLGAE